MYTKPQMILMAQTRLSISLRTRMSNGVKQKQVKLRKIKIICQHLMTRPSYLP